MPKCIKYFPSSFNYSIGFPKWRTETPIWNCQPTLLLIRKAQNQSQYLYKPWLNMNRIMQHRCYRSQIEKERKMDTKIECLHNKFKHVQTMTWFNQPNKQIQTSKSSNSSTLLTTKELYYECTIPINCYAYGKNQ